MAIPVQRVVSLTCLKEEFPETWGNDLKRVVIVVFCVTIADLALKGQTSIAWGNALGKVPSIDSCLALKRQSDGGFPLQPPYQLRSSLIPTHLAFCNTFVQQIYSNSTLLALPETGLFVSSGLGSRT